MHNSGQIVTVATCIYICMAFQLFCFHSVCYTITSQQRTVVAYNTRSQKHHYSCGSWRLRRRRCERWTDYMHDAWPSQLLVLSLTMCIGSIADIGHDMCVWCNLTHTLHNVLLTVMHAICHHAWCILVILILYYLQVQCSPIQFREASNILHEEECMLFWFHWSPRQMYT